MLSQHVILQGTLRGLLVQLYPTGGSLQEANKVVKCTFKELGNYQMNKEVKMSLLETRHGRDLAEMVFVIWYVLDKASHALWNHANARSHSTVLCVPWWPPFTTYQEVSMPVC